jgi:hypothetical protein
MRFQRPSGTGRQQRATVSRAMLPTKEHRTNRADSGRDGEECGRRERHQRAARGRRRSSCMVGDVSATVANSTTTAPRKATGPALRVVGHGASSAAAALLARPATWETSDDGPVCRKPKRLSLLSSSDVRSEDCSARIFPEHVRWVAQFSSLFSDLGGFERGFALVLGTSTSTSSLRARDRAAGQPVATGATSCLTSTRFMRWEI